jgi:hypothetical protein
MNLELIEVSHSRLSSLYIAACNNDIDTIWEVPEISDFKSNSENGYTSLHRDKLEAAQEIIIGWTVKGLDINLKDGITGNTPISCLYEIK